MMNEKWPPLPYSEWKDTYATLHLCMQIVGKIRLVQTPWVNHSWHVTLYVTARGLTTSPIPYEDGVFEIVFDFLTHQLQIQLINGSGRTIPLRGRPVAGFYQEVLRNLNELGVHVRIHTMPNELPNVVPFEKDFQHNTYNPDHAQRFWRVLVQCDRVMKNFRSRFSGKCSPVHFFWGSFDLAVTRFSGRTAPEHPGGVPNLPDWVAKEAYSHEVSSCGFWPGNDQAPFPLFYSYAYPEPAGFNSAKVLPAGAAQYHKDLREFILPYEAVRTAESPDDTLMEFLQSTYEAAANLGGWDRAALEKEL